MSEHAFCLLKFAYIILVYWVFFLDIHSSLLSLPICEMAKRFLAAGSKIMRPFFWYLHFDNSHRLWPVPGCARSLCRFIAKKNGHLLYIFRNFNFEWAIKISVVFVEPTYIYQVWSFLLKKNSNFLFYQLSTFKISPPIGLLKNLLRSL